MTRKERRQYLTLAVAFAVFTAGLVVYGRSNRYEPPPSPALNTPEQLARSWYRPGPEGEWRGEVGGPANVIDGDTIRIAGIRLRLGPPDGDHEKGIDAPELRQQCRRGREIWACGEASASALADMIGRQEVVCRETGERPSWGRHIVVCHTEAGVNLSAAMVRDGWAIPFQWDDASGYRVLHGEAATASRGIWSAEFQWPWVWRDMPARDRMAAQ